LGSISRFLVFPFLDRLLDLYDTIYSRCINVSECHAMFSIPYVFDYPCMKSDKKETVRF